MTEAPNLDHNENERDINTVETSVIAIWTIVCTAIFFASCLALFTYFRWELAAEQQRKILTATNPDYENVKAAADKTLAGGAIEKAMKAAVAEARSK